MATATQKELLNEARKADNANRERMDKLAEHVKQAADDMEAGPEPHPIHELKLTDDDADPFNGNLNNRRVAARIAKRIEASYGDPVKARADVEQSLRVNPEPQIRTGDELPEIKLVSDKKPSPGSPADLKGKSQTQVGGSESPKEQQAAATAKQHTSGGKKENPPQWKSS